MHKSSDWFDDIHSSWLLMTSIALFYLVYMVLMYRQAKIQDIRDYEFMLYLNLVFLNIYYLEYESKYHLDPTIAEGKDATRVGHD